MSRENAGLNVATYLAAGWTFATGWVPQITANQAVDFAIKIISVSATITLAAYTIAHYRASRRREDAQKAREDAQRAREDQQTLKERAETELAQERLRRLRLGLDEDEVSP